MAYKNPEDKLKYMKEYVKRDYVKQKWKEYYQKNKKKILSKQKKYYQKDKKQNVQGYFNYRLYGGKNPRQISMRRPGYRKSR